ncbi:replicative DNA helicase [Kingella oralis ATCC 51147]|jgi:dnaB-like helicase N terminal domain|uniref:DNA 5'-3' helicase n=2 Tax=Kingella TaxID=32257 RepID=C4GFT2_9NEIS|nr:replicative DNA helicase [Kingella oralis ATCC 51147]
METEMNFASMEAEQSLLGGLLLENAAFAKIGSLKAEMFANHQHKILFDTLSAMLANHEPADIVTVGEKLEQRGALETVGGMDYLVTLAQHTPSAANIARYAQIVRDRYGMRELLGAGQQIAEMRNDDLTLPEMQAKAVELVAQASRATQGASKVKFAGEIVQDLIAYYDQIMQMPNGAMLGFSTGLKALDATTQGLRRGDLSVIGGRPSMGKSILAENIARHNAKKGLAVRIQSYEMGAKDLAIRGCAADKEVDYGNARRGRMTAGEVDLLNDYINELSGWNLSVDSESLNIDELVAECRIQKQQHGLDLLVVDHIHLMPLQDVRNEVRELDEITAKLKRLAIELDIHVIAVAQLNRGKEKALETRPTMSDIRGSGGIEQNANLVIFPYRPAYYDNSENPTKAELILAKNRDGMRGTLHIGFRGEYQKFTNDFDPLAAPQNLDEQAQRESVYDI